jgi:hypothetical protein
MTSKCIPQRLWDFCCRWACKVNNTSASSLYALEDRIPFEATLGDTPDISSLIPFDFYDLIWYYDEVSAFPEPKCKLGRWLGEARDFGQAMCYWILSDKATPIIRSTIQVIPPDKLALPETIEIIVALDKIINEKLGEVTTNIPCMTIT